MRRTKREDQRPQVSKTCDPARARFWVGEHASEGTFDVRPELRRRGQDKLRQLPLEVVGDDLRPFHAVRAGIIS